MKIGKALYKTWHLIMIYYIELAILIAKSQVVFKILKMI